MNIAKYRSAFSVFVIDGDSHRGSEVANRLGQTGYNCHLVLDQIEIEQRISDTPPHIVLLALSDNADVDKQLVKHLLRLLPEVQLILLAENEQFQQGVSLYSEGIYDCLALPLSHTDLLIQAVDRAATTNYFIYMNEQLKDQLQEGRPKASPSSLALFEVWLVELHKKKTLEASVQHFLKECRRYLSGEAIAFFKYLPGQQSLVLAQAEGHSLVGVRGHGIDLTENANLPPMEQLQDPQRITGMKQLVENTLGWAQYDAFVFRVQSDVRGIFVLPVNSVTVKNGEATDPYVKACLGALGQLAITQGLERKIHRLSQVDEVTGLLNRSNFLQAVRAEVSRARRITQPVSLAILSIDHFSKYLEQQPRDAHVLLKAIAQVVSENSRLNDVVGRLGPTEIGLIMPHTPKKGAALKSERLRRIVETLSLVHLVKNPPTVTLSIGVGEYPSLCSDADELLKAVDEALDQVKRAGHNRVCLSSVPSHFVPDFFVEPK